MVAALVVVAVGCADRGAHRPAVATEGEDPWSKLRVGDLAGAERVLAGWLGHPDKRPLAIAGQLRIASLTRDDERIAELVRAVPRGSPFAIRMLAAAAAMVDAKLSPSERDVVRAACPPPPEVAAKPVVRAICAQAAVFEGRDAIMACRRGCEGRQRAPMLAAGALAVVTATVAGSSEPVPFVVDTGAATSTLSRAFVAEHGLTPLSGTMHPIGSSAGAVTSMFVLAPLRFGDREIEDVRFAVVDVSVAGVAGILSPHDVFRGARVTLDFRERVFEVGPTVAELPDGMAGFPLLYQARRPHILVAVDGRDPRPMALDTGADRTRLMGELEALGEPWPRSGQTGSRSLGGTLRVGKVAGALAAEAGGIAFGLEEPLVYPKLPVAAPFDLGSFGLLGIEVFEGRVLALDLPSRRVDLSRQVALRPWPVGAAQELVVSGRDFHDEIVVHEEVTARDGDRVTLDVTWSSGEAREHLRLAVIDDEAARRTWLVTRPIEEAWSLTGDQPEALSVTQARQRLAKVITVFQPRGQGAFDVATVDGQACGRLTIPSALDGKAAVARIVSCPTTPWRVRSVELEQGGEVVWRLRQRASR